MTPSKRIFDVVIALVCVVLLAVPAILAAALLLLFQGWPVFYLSERMKTPESGFSLWKFRTMEMSSFDSGVSGGDKTFRITKIGRLLRRSRLDEVPQLWNILRGDMSFVGPRPPLKTYVNRYPHLYSRVLQSRPGLTGLATIAFHKREQALLADSTSAAETDAIYVRRCLPRKAQLDLIYTQKQTLWLDVFIIARTAWRILT